jgi:hypothetical protein
MPIRIVLRLTEDYRASRFEFLIQGVHVSDEDVDCVMSGQPAGVVGGLKMDNHAVSFHSSIERRLAIGELSAKTEGVTIMLDASEHVLHDK